MTHWCPKGPARAVRKVRDLPVPRGLGQRWLREARAAERANEERKRNEETLERETPAVQKAGRAGRAEVREAREVEGEDVARRPKKGRR